MSQDLAMSHHHHQHTNHRLTLTRILKGIGSFALVAARTMICPDAYARDRRPPECAALAYPYASLSEVSSVKSG